MITIHDYALDKDDVIYALVVQSNDTWLATPVKNDITRWTLVSKLEDISVGLGVSLSPMQFKDDTLYIVDRDDQTLFALRNYGNGATDEYPLPRKAEGNNNEFEFDNETLYIQSDKGQHKLYLGGKGVLLSFDDNNKQWSTFFTFNQGEDPAIVRANEDIMVVATSFGYMYVAPIGTSNFVEKVQLIDPDANDKNKPPYAIFFNTANKFIIITYLDGNIDTFKYNINYTNGTVTLNLIKTLKVEGFKLDQAGGTLANSTLLGRNTEIGMINVNNAPHYSYNSVRIDNKANIYVDKTDKEFTYTDNQHAVSIPKFTIYANGVSFFLDFAGNLYASTTLGENWQQLDINLVDTVQANA